MLPAARIHCGYGKCSSISNLTSEILLAYGGGGGGSFHYNNVADSAGRAGASGGGAAGKYTTAAAGVSGQGNDGGVAIGNDNTSAGGGGAGAKGGDADSATQSGSGGVGVPCAITGATEYYGGGGGGGNYGGTGGQGGLGGGGNGTGGQNTNHTAGTDGLGGGGGGASGGGNKWEYCGGAKGGDGVVMIRLSTVNPFVPVLSVAATAVTSRKATLRFTAVSVGVDKSQTVDVYAAIALAGDSMPTLEKIGESVANNGQYLYSFDVLYDRDYVVYSKIVNTTTEIESSVMQTEFSTPERALVAMPGVVRWNKGVDGSDPKGSNEFRDPWFLFDGYPQNFMTMKSNPSDMWIMLDTGDVHNLALLRFYCYDNNSPGRAKSMQIFGSTDNVNWTKIHDQGGETPVYNVWTTNVVTGSYRYFKIEKLEYGQMGEIEFLSDDTVLKSERPCPWGDNIALGANDAVAGVKVAGTLKFAYAGSAEIFGYYADADYDNNVSAWAANGTRFDIGTVQEGQSFSANVQVPGRGVKYLRLFAKNKDNSVVASQRTEAFAVGTAVYCPKAYTTFSDNSKGVKWYNGSTSDYGDNNGDGNDLIFDLTSLPAGFCVCSMRVWPRIDNSGARFQQWARCRTGEIFASDTAAQFSGTAISAGTNEVYAVSPMPSQAWTHLEYLNDWIQDFDPRVQEIVIPEAYRNSGYLKLAHVNYDQLCDVELRICKRVAGMVIIYR